jgi:hypothetical protein
VSLEDLRHLRLRHWRFDGTTGIGELVVHVDAVDAIVSAFRGLFDAGFPIERMELVDVYDGDDDRSMAANNTSAFNCRRSTGGTGWSEHAYGRAVDINPVQNPYISRGSVQPSAGQAFRDRGHARTGMIIAGDSVVAAFDRVGWQWGGGWSSPKDYQHFSASGR